MKKLILASGSPRRQEMLKSLGLKFKIQLPKINEAIRKGESPLHYVQRLAFEKAYVIARPLTNHDYKWRVLAADTIVVFKNKVLGKPRSQSEAVMMLKKLSGKKHKVVTAFSWIGNSKSRILVDLDFVVTEVCFTKFDTSFCKWYVSTGEPMDKAGAYAAQGIGLSFIKSVVGSYSNVIGLPLPQVLALYQKQFNENLLNEFK